MKPPIIIDHSDKKQRRLTRLFSFLILSVLMYMVFSIVVSTLFAGVKNLQINLNSDSQITPPPIFTASYLIAPYGVSAMLPLLGALTVAILGCIRVSGWILRLIKPKTVIEGSSRWATMKEIRKTLEPVPMDNIPSAQKSGIILAADEDNYYIDHQTVNSFIVGTTRSGKGQYFLLPMLRLIAQSRDQHSMVLNDPKGELAENTYDLLTRAGYKVVILNFRDPKLSSRWNPLALIIEEYIQGIESEDQDVSKAVELVGELALTLTQNKQSDPIWPESAKSLLTAIILYLLEKGYKHDCLDTINMFSVYTFLCEYGSKTIKVGQSETTRLDILFSDLPVGTPAKLYYTTSNFAKGEMRSSIFATLSANLQIFTDTGIASLTAANDIHADDLTDPAQPCAIFMVVPDDKANRHPLASLFITQTYTRLVDLASQEPGQKLRQRVIFQLDEFSNMTRIPHMETKISVCLGRNILFNLYAQDVEQLEVKYDKGIAKTLLGNCGNYVYINSLSQDTNKLTSDLLGKQTIEYTTFMGELGDVIENRVNTHLKGRELLTTDELLRLQAGEAVVVRQRQYPIRTKIEPYFKLGIPIIPIRDMQIPRTEVHYRDVLFPFDLLTASPGQEPEAVPIADPEDATERFRNELLSRMNAMTSADFGTALQSGDFKACQKMIEIQRFRKNINPEEVMLLKTIVAEFREKALIPVGQILVD